MESRPGGSAVARGALEVIGPITGGTHGWPFGGYLGDIGDEHGYVEEEFFIAGNAKHYEPTGILGDDGKWAVTAGGEGPFTTRLLVRRPKDARKFNGTVIIEWANVSAGFEVSLGDMPGLYEGSAYVSVSAQFVGLHGLKQNPVGLKTWDSQRYGELSHPGDSFSYDIFTQAARSVGPDRHSAVDPMGGLEVRKLIAIGGSQSGSRLNSYSNAIQPLEGVFDAIMPLLAGASTAGFGDTLLDPSTLFTLSPSERAQLVGPSTRIRDDLDISVMVINSEYEAPSYFPFRQPDTDKFRYWEVAGASHMPRSQSELMSLKHKRDGVLSEIAAIRFPVS